MESISRFDKRTKNGLIVVELMCSKNRLGELIYFVNYLKKDNEFFDSGDKMFYCDRNARRHYLTLIEKFIK